MKPRRTKLFLSPKPAAELLRAGGIGAFPTETVFGLGADARNRAAIQELFSAKGRPADNPLIVHLPSWKEWHQAAESLTPAAQSLLQAFSPGPISIVLPKKSLILDEVTAGLDTVAIRIPSCPVARDLLRECQCPIAAPSANLSGKPSSTHWQSVLEDLDGRIDFILCKNASEIGLESTVVDCCTETPVILRTGAITLQQIQSIVPSATLLAASNPNQSNHQLNSPGLRHAHYQPNSPVVLFDTLEELAGLSANNRANSACCTLLPIDASQWKIATQFPSLEAYATHFYEFLREADRAQVAQIYIHKAKPIGIGQALRDRQYRSANQPYLE